MDRKASRHKGLRKNCDKEEMEIGRVYGEGSS